MRPWKWAMRYCKAAMVMAAFAMYLSVQINSGILFVASYAALAFTIWFYFDTKGDYLNEQAWYAVFDSVYYDTFHGGKLQADPNRKVQTIETTIDTKEIF